MPNYITVLIWGDVPTVYTNSRTIQLSCDHQKIGDYLITNDLQINPLPGATLPVGETDDASRTYPPQRYELGTYPPGEGVKKVTLVKDNTTNRQLYVDYDSYAANIIGCNVLPYMTSCPDVTGITAGSITTTGATITFATDGVSGYEWINKTSGVTPVIDGTFTAGSPVVITGLTTGTLYHFYIKKRCPGGLASSWATITFTTS